MVSHGYRSDFLKTKMIKKNKRYLILFLAVYFGAKWKIMQDLLGGRIYMPKRLPFTNGLLCFMYLHSLLFLSSSYPQNVPRSS